MDPQPWPFGPVAENQCSYYVLVMPAPYLSANPYRCPHLKDAASMGMLISVRCPLCRRTVNYWAADLVRVLGRNYPLHRAPFPCSRCKTSELYVSWKVPGPADLNDLTVRRPVRQVVRWIWRDERA